MARIGLVAHDDRKDDLVAWANKHKHKLSEHELWGTGTTGGRISEGTGLTVTRLLSGPLGGDAQIGAMIAEGRLEPAGFFDVYPEDDAPEFNGAWSAYPFFPSGVVAVSGIEQGLFLLAPEIP